MISSNFPHIRSLMNRAGGTVLLYWAFSFGISILLAMIWAIGIVMFALANGQDMSAALEGSSALSSDSLFLAFAVFLSPFAAWLTALAGGALTRIRLKPLLGPSRMKVSGLIVITVVAMGMTTVVDFMSEFLKNALSLLNLHLYVPEFLTSVPTEPLAAFLYAAAICIGAPVFEEFLCRGILLHAIKPYGNGFAVIVSALFFGLIHGNFIQAPGAFVFGIFLGIVTLRTGSLRPAILIHAFNNTFFVLTEYVFMPLEEKTAHDLWIIIQIGIVTLACIILIINWAKIKPFLGIMRHRNDPGVHDDRSEGSQLPDMNTSDPYWPRRWSCFWTSGAMVSALVVSVLMLLAAGISWF
ncbi:MAG: CPBP family intramembrane metalloprotease [Peptococcaceae bacterium]|nr:CPBP family intramembrane metalloprotease [Peptococcaceae bacterium]